jgi:hypothetical protein
LLLTAVVVYVYAKQREWLKSEYNIANSLSTFSTFIHIMVCHVFPSAGIKAHTPGIDSVVMSTHCHDDLGLATANSLAGVLAGEGLLLTIQSVTIVKDSESSNTVLEHHTVVDGALLLD